MKPDIQGTYGVVLYDTKRNSISVFEHDLPTRESALQRRDEARAEGLPAHWFGPVLGPHTADADRCGPCSAYLDLEMKKANRKR